MSDKAYTNSQVETLKSNAQSARERLKTLSQENSRFGELEAYSFGLSLFPCGRVPKDEEGLVINKSMALLLEDCLTILEQFVKCDANEEEPDDSQNNDEECDKLFEAIENLNIDVDYDRIKKDTQECCHETQDLINNIKTNITNNLNTGFNNINSNINSISTQITVINTSIATISANISTIINNINTLLQCPCDANIINAIKIDIEALKTDINNQLTTLSLDIDNLNLDGAEVSIDYQPIWERFTNLQTFISNQTTTITFYIRSQTTLVISALQNCCKDILKKLDTLDFDLSPVIEKIESSKLETIEAFNLSIDNAKNATITQINDVRTAILNGQVTIQNVIIARIDEYLNKEYSGDITIQDFEGNEQSFSFSGIGLDGILSIISMAIEIMKLLFDREDSPCDNMVLIYSDRHPAQVLESQLEITFIEEGTEWKPDSIKKKVTVHNPRTNLDFCSDIYPLILSRGSAVFGRMDWKYAKRNADHELYVIESWTGGYFSSESAAISFLNQIGSLSQIKPESPRITKGGKAKQPVSTAIFRPVRAVLALFDDAGNLLEKRCLEPPSDGC